MSAQHLKRARARPGGRHHGVVSPRRLPYSHTQPMPPGQHRSWLGVPFPRAMRARTCARQSVLVLDGELGSRTQTGCPDGDAFHWIPPEQDSRSLVSEAASYRRQSPLMRRPGRAMLHTREPPARATTAWPTRLNRLLTPSSPLRPPALPLLAFAAATSVPQPITWPAAAIHHSGQECHV
ncbi:hypothetical protein MAPG_08644 [Magnaporthiopsis poae ATCC 64411]|uniref:Uncharacterized protein n=1 Tax=Magnaporthiopsis poae (strain ATCC 64411 / 73-15) TaxID=644358 RepID=A0A0C4E7W6_MAGP6|nr:hypothetical protein MAPG_08644 [Magnaporthiopsis poae ATCC 64411]